MNYKLFGAGRNSFERFFIFFLVLAPMAGWLFAPSMAAAVNPYYSTSDIMVGIEGGGGFGDGGGGSMTVNGYTFDPVAAAKAILAGAWGDPDLANMLKAYAIDNPNNYTSVTPAQLTSWLDGVVSEQYDVDNFTATVLGEEETQSLTDTKSKSYSDLLFNIQKTAQKAGDQAFDLEAWCDSVNGSTENKYNPKLGVWYNAAANGGKGAVVYALADGKMSTVEYSEAKQYLNNTDKKDTAAKEYTKDEDPILAANPTWGRDEHGYYEIRDGVMYRTSEGSTKLQDANDVLNGGQIPSDDSSACDALGADSWLSDGTGKTSGSIGSGPKGSGSGGGGGGGGGGGTEPECSRDSDCASGKECRSGSCITKTVTAVSPIVTNTTGSNQIKSSFKLTVTTNRSAGCQYKTSSFSFGEGSTFDTTGDTGHSTTLYSLTNATYNYYVVCKDTATGGVSTVTPVNFTVDLSADPANAPEVTNDTAATLTNSTSALKVKTNRTANCEYNESGGFTFGTGTDFSTTGSFGHNTDLTGLTNGSNKTYYVVCKDVATGAVSAALKIMFTVNLSGGENAPMVSNITPATQTNTSPVLAVTTNLQSACRYSTTSGFAYANGSQINTSDNYSHSVSLAALTDASYTFYVICKANDTGAASSALAVTTVLDRPDVQNNQPVITNTTAGYQTESDAVLSVKTEKAATCQYKATSFNFGGGTAFSTTGSTAHSATLTGLNNGPHSYFVSCKDTASGEMNATSTQVMFTLAAGAEADKCAKLSSNDRQNNSERSESGSGKDDTSYLWQAVESGTREKFDQVDWFAGYQFSVGEDGKATELCGYFEDGQSNDIFLYNGSYAELAKAKVTGSGDWECVDIDEVELSADTRYYVITKINNQAIYYEYESGFLPVDTGKAVIEAGIRQTVNSTFNKNIIKYDYMIFGLVDVKISYTSENTEGPKITSTSPSGKVSDSNVFISVDTVKDSTCRFDRDDVDYGDMKYTLQEVSDGTYSQKVCNLEDGAFTFYVRCSKGDKANNASAAVEFTVEN